MKKWVLILSLIFLISTATFFIKNIEKNVPIGKATQTALTITINLLGPPTLTLHAPSNGTYLSINDLFLNFTALSADNLLYNLNSGTNTTITSPTYFNVSSAGSYTLFLYANNSNGTASKNVTFYVNQTLFVIIDDEYETQEDPDEDNGIMERNAKKGESTDFLNYTYEELQNLNDLILHEPNYGKISFNEPINITDDANPGDNELNLNNNINISLNRIDINSTALPNFNKPATLWLYNLTFSNPRILKDGGVCPDSICTQENYSGGILKFNVTQFSVYSSEETSTSSSSSSSSTSGGGGGRGSIRNFSVNKEGFKIKLKRGEFKIEKIKIKNTGTNIDKFNIIISPNLEELIKIEEKTFSLAQNQEKVIEITFLAEENIIPGLYLGEIIIESNGVKKQIFAAIEVESKEVLLDVRVEIPSKYEYVLPGEEILFKVELINLGERKRQDVLVGYIIKSQKGEIIISEEERLALETRLSHIKIFELPKSLEYGEYVVYVRAIYNEKTASASSWVNVGKEPFLSREKIVLLIIIIAIIILLFLLYKFKKRRKKINLIKYFS